MQQQHQLPLTQIAYTQVGASSLGCLALLPSTTSATSKVVIGDQHGVVTVFAMKRGELLMQFQTPPGAPIRALHVGKERVFAASGVDVAGYSKKGKRFYNITTLMTQPISQLSLEDDHLHVSGQLAYSCYVDNRDVHHALLPDVIHAMVTCLLPCEPGGRLAPPGVVRQHVVLACGDRQLHVIAGSTLAFTVPLPAGIPTVLCLVDPASNDGVLGEVIYGTQSGIFGQVLLSTTGAEHVWTGPQDKRQAAIQCIGTYALSGVGARNILLGRNDGSVEVYTLGALGDDGPPRLLFKTRLSSGITGIVGGRVRNPDFDEIIVSTYAGQVVGFTTEQLAAADAKHLRRQEIERLHQELGELEATVTAQRATVEARHSLTRKVESTTSTLPPTAAEPSPATLLSTKQQPVPVISQLPLVDVPVTDSFSLQEDDASYLLTIELATSIDVVVVQCDIQIDLLDTKDNAAVVSFTDCGKGRDGNHLLATYRCRSGVTRLQLKIRSIEGEYGTLRVYALPAMSPKQAVVRTYGIRALSFHHKINQPFDESRPFNTLTLTGNFSMAEIHRWLCVCLPDLTAKPPSESERVLVCQSTFLGTLLECTYADAKAFFRSDNVTTISVLKDVLSKEATRHKVALNTSFTISDASVEAALRLMAPKLEEQLALTRKMALLEPLKELQAQESADAPLSAEYRAILAESESLTEKYKLHPCYLQRLYGMVTDLFIDKFKFKGLNVKNKVPRLVDELNNFDLAALVAFFESADGLYDPDSDTLAK